jgi:adenine C2-methylase RlmN of 23S rRNA A2503 and tRNA A37
VPAKRDRLQLTGGRRLTHLVFMGMGEPLYNEDALHHLRALHVPVTVRWPRGREAQGACGQLMLASG